MEKNLFAKPMATSHVPETLLIGYSNNSTLSAAAVAGLSAWLSLA